VRRYHFGNSQWIGPGIVRRIVMPVFGLRQLAKENRLLHACRKKELLPVK
jgi:hypothetical protein